MYVHFQEILLSGIKLNLERDPSAPDDPSKDEMEEAMEEDMEEDRRVSH